SAFVQAFDTMFGGFRERAAATYKLLRAPGTAFLVIAAPESDAVREAAYFVDRLASESMPLAGLILNRTHPVLADLPAARAETAAEALERDGDKSFAAAVLRLHVDRVAVAGRERRLLSRFRSAHPAVAVARVPALAVDVHDLPGLREIGRLLATAQPVTSRD
ncbi:MAG TPA: ArsA family ATPase, partial [Pseudonocardiaceae bacterium]|nr:ArsA family ATPase [Pseudonocardiaceae bacterium]